MSASTMVKKVDLIIRNALLIDGTGSLPVSGDIAINDKIIIALGDLGTLNAAKEIDVAGKAVAPGFIDVHTHDDRVLLTDPLMACKVSQGVTTVITGNCGVSLAPLSRSVPLPPPLNMMAPKAQDFFPSVRRYLSALDKDPPAVNSLTQVGHSTLRLGAMEALDHPASLREINTMRRVLEKSLDEGAIGLSTGLFYEPARAAPTDEVIVLAKSLADAGAIHTTHMRDEADGVAQSLKETFAIGKAAQVPVVISHHKCAGACNHGRSRETLALIEAARREQVLGLDVYPYTAGSTVLNVKRTMGATRIVVTESVPHPECGGRELSDIAAEWNLSVEQTADKLQPAGAIYFTMDETDVQRILRYPHSMIGSDGLPGETHPHPRLWGTFPRVLGHYVRDVGLFALEEAVRKMTSLPAEQFGLTGRGVLAPGAFADLVIFDPDTIADQATFEQPTTPASGIDLVYVNGRCIWKDGVSTGARPGKAIRLQDCSIKTS